MKLHLAAMLFAPMMLYAQSAPDRAEITALSKTFLRDSAELPMDVVVTTVVTDAKGKKKRNAHSKMRFIFHGYNGQSGHYSFRATSGLFSMRVLHDSVAPNFALINAFSRLVPGAKDVDELTLDGLSAHSPAGTDCGPFQMSQKFLYAEKHCWTSDFRLNRDASGALGIEQFSVDVEQLPAAAKVLYLGDVEVQGIHSEGAVQQARLLGDDRPFLIPKRVVTTIRTDKGTIVVTNAYSLAAPPQK